MAKRDIVVVGASFGGVETLQKVVAGLPAAFPGAIFVTQHIPAEAPSLLPQILTRAGKLPAEQARDMQPIQPGRIYVAPPDQHLQLEREFMRLSHGPRVNNQRPAVDVLFRSAARAFRARTVGVVLTGALDCGSAGLVAVKRYHGVSVVQEPADAICPDMPLHALAAAEVDYVATSEEIPALIARLVEEDAPAPASVPEEAEPEPGHDPPDEVEIKHYSCPGCGGALEVLGHGAELRFRCHMGHGFTSANLEVAQGEMLEAALWTALRALEERARLAARMAHDAAVRDLKLSQARYEERAKAAEEQASLLRAALKLGGRKG